MINYNFIQKIFTRKKTIKSKKEKEELSKYTDYIPMYDIYSDTVYPIASENLNYRLLKCHYRFINDEVRQWIQNKLDKTDDKVKKQKYLDNLAIIDCYDLSILEKTSYETLYRYSPDLGLSISICKRNSFNPFSTHLTPYYTKLELIRLGMNNRIIKKINPSNLVDKKAHYTICKKVSKNDISYTTISEHMKATIENNCIGWIQYYSMTGSYIFNKILRESLEINRSMYDGLMKIIDTIDKISLPDDYYFYRFVWDDDYINQLKIGQTFTDNGFISTTRDPFYSPGIKKDFGLILIRINIPKKMKSCGLLMENFSMFPKEEEYLIKPGSKLKLLSKDTNTTYYHIDEKFEKLIKKKYEFVLIETSNKIKLKIVEDSTIPSINIDNITLEGYDRYDLFTQFKKQTNSIGQYTYKDKIFITEFFDSTTSYQHLYYNKTKDGMLHTTHYMGYPEISIECGDKLVVNYLKTKCYYDIIRLDKFDPLNQIIAMYCKLFSYGEALVFFEYNNFVEFKDNYTNNIEFLSINLYCKTIYDYIKNKKQTNNKYYKFEYGFWKIDKIVKTYIPEEITNRLPASLKDSFKKEITWGELFIEIVEKYFYLYSKMEEWFNTYHDNLFKNNFYIFNTTLYLKSSGYTVSDISKFKHIITRERGDMYRIVYEESARRI
jgi:hypothetical protein